MYKNFLIKNIVILSSFLGFVSCDDSQVYDEYHVFKDGWKQNRAVNFYFEKNASNTPYNLFINVRNNNDYEFSNLFLIIKLEEPKGLTKVDTLEYEMAYPDGTLMGNGITDLKESKLWYKKKLRFLQTGKYKLTIMQAVRASGKVEGVKKLEGIKEIGFRIEK